MFCYSASYLLQFQRYFNISFSCSYLFLKYNLENTITIVGLGVCCHAVITLWSYGFIPSVDHPALIPQALMLRNLFCVPLTSKALSLLISITRNTKSFVNREHC